jgi:putative two-component system response regulator
MDCQQWMTDQQRAVTAVFAQPSEWRRSTPPNAHHPPAPQRARVSSFERASIEEIRRHARRLAVFATAVGRHIGLAAGDLQRLRTGSLLHDVGKTALPPQVLFKCGRLTAQEFAAVKYHPVIGDLLCAQVPGLSALRPMVRHHHERLDGSGYPDGLAGDAIPLLAQIVGVADVFDALVYARPYKPAFDADHAFSLLRREVDLGWRSADLVDALIAIVESGEADWLSTVASV